MSRYSIERREWVLRQMMPPGNRSVSELAEETGISAVTLYAWRKQARAAGAVVPGDPQPLKVWGLRESRGGSSWQARLGYRTVCNDNHQSFQE